MAALRGARRMAASAAAWRGGGASLQGVANAAQGLVALRQWAAVAVSAAAWRGGCGRARGMAWRNGTAAVKTRLAVAWFAAWRRKKRRVKQNRHAFSGGGFAGGFSLQKTYCVANATRAARSL